MKLSRRTFLKSSAGAAAAVTLSTGINAHVFGAAAQGLAVGPGNKWPGRIVINYDKTAVAANGTGSSTIIPKMIDDSIKLLTGETAVGAAWKTVFPASLTAQSKIAIKVNCLNYGQPATNRLVVSQIVAGLKQMDFGGTAFTAGNIYIYDMNNGSTASLDKMVQAGFSAANFPGVHLVDQDSSNSFGDGARNLAYATTLNTCDFLINCPSLRGHSDYAERVTLGFKAHYGTYAPVHSVADTPGYLRDINCTGPVYDKTVLTVCSALYAMDEGNGPDGPTDDYSTYVASVDSSSTNPYSNTVLMSTDPVSLDFQAIKIMRLNQVPAGAHTIASMPKYLRASAGVAGALDPTLNIGIIDESAMDIRRIINGVTSVFRPYGVHAQGMDGFAVAATSIRGQANTLIEYAVSAETIGREVRLDIFSLSGVRIFTRNHSAQGSINHFAWNEKDNAGRMAARGEYAIRLTAGSRRVSSRFVLE